MTDKQKMLYDAALASNMLTDDPYVNWCVDNHFTDGYSPYDKKLEVEHIRLHIATGGFVLSIIGS